MKRNFRKAAFALPLATLVSSFASSAHAADTVAVRWADIMLDIIRVTHPLPPVSARYLAIMDTCMYDAWTAYDSRAVPTQETALRAGTARLRIRRRP